MNLFAKIFAPRLEGAGRSRFERKSGSVTIARLREIGAGWFSGSAPESAFGIGAVLCCARVIAEGLAQVETGFHRRSEGAGGRRTERVTDHVGAALLRRPNRFQTTVEFIESGILAAVLTGDFLAVKLRAGDTAKELIPILPGLWSAAIGPDGRRVYTVNSGALARPGIYKARDVLHLRGPSWGPVTGLDVVRQAARAIGLAASLEGMQDISAKTGLRPSGVIQTPQPLSDEATDGLVAEWDKRFGVNGAGGVLVLDAGLTFAAQETSAADAETIATREFQIKEICRFFRVFPQMVMTDAASSTYASAEQFFMAHVVHTLAPWARRLEAVLERDLIAAEAPDPTIFVRCNVEALTRGTARDMAETHRVYWNLGALSANEIRSELGLDPYAGGDAFRAPLNTETVGEDADGAGNEGGRK